MQPRTARAFAKINIGLWIIRRRPDGYHDLATVFHRIALADELTVRQAAVISVSSSAPDVPSDETNLCHRAARLLQQECPQVRGALITLLKRIPAGAGLGGGSSDAAAVLRLLPDIWDVPVTEGALETLAAALGSDVPYFLHPGSALGTGRGERLEYFELEVPYTILLCTPPLHVSTAWAYSQITPAAGRDPASLREAVKAGMRDPRFLRETAANDFEGPVLSAYPEIGRLKRELLEQGAVFASLSGSGASLYGFYDDPAAARRAAGLLQARGTAVHLTPPLYSPRWEP